MVGASMDEDDKKYQSRSEVAWARPFVPDIPTESSSLLGWAIFFAGIGFLTSI